MKPWHIYRAARFGLQFVVDWYLAATGFGKKQAVSNSENKKSDAVGPLKKKNR